RAAAMSAGWASSINAWSRASAAPAARRSIPMNSASDFVMAIGFPAALYRRGRPRRVQSTEQSRSTSARRRYEPGATRTLAGWYPAAPDRRHLVPVAGIQSRPTRTLVVGAGVTGRARRPSQPRASNRASIGTSSSGGRIMEHQEEHHEAVQVAQDLETAHDADVAEALNAIDHEAAARVLAALPFDLPARAADQPALDQRAPLFERLATDKAVALMTGMSADQRTEVFRGLSDRARTRLMPAIDEGTRASLRSLLSYAPTTAGGIMTTEHVEAPATWTVERTLAQIRLAGQPHHP